MFWKMIFMTIIVIICAISLSCSDNPLTDDFKQFERGGDNVDYFPLAVGNVWRYKVTVLEGNQVFTDSTYITGITTQEGKMCYRVKEAYFPFDVYCYEDTTESLTKLYKYDLSSPATSSWHEYLIFHEQLPGGQMGTCMWFWQYNTAYPSYVGNYIWQSADETVKTPVGIFVNCFKVHREIVVVGQIFHLYYWYAPGVGLVAFSNPEYKLELIGYEIH